jgi:hypothetical protein
MSAESTVIEQQCRQAVETNLFLADGGVHLGGLDILGGAKLVNKRDARDGRYGRHLC